jgi:hypothetical protein
MIIEHSSSEKPKIETQVKCPLPCYSNASGGYTLIEARDLEQAVELSKD